jgi:Major capsid protein Gp23
MATKIFKKLNDASVSETWTPVLESYGANVSNRPWLVEYAHNHAIFDNSGAVNEASLAPGLFLQQPGSIGAMGAISAPTSSMTPFTGMGAGSLTKGSYASSATGSGDKFPSLLPVAIQVAAKTIGFDLVGVVPMDAPVGFLPYLDYVYQGGNVDTAYEPYLIKIPRMSASIAVGKYIKSGDWYFQFVGKSRVDGQFILKVLYGTDTANSTVADKIAAIDDTSIGSHAGTYADPYDGLGTTAITAAEVSLVSALENHISGFTSFSDTDWTTTDGTKDMQGPFMNSTTGYEPEGMTRANSENSKFRQMGLRMFTKFIEAKADQVSISATVEQIQDLNRVWNFDVISMLENVAVNELAQSINKKLVDRVLALGSNHAATIETVEGNGGANICGLDLTVGSTGFENTSTLQRRVVTKILEMANLIYHRGRFGAGTYIVTNGRVASALADVAGYSFAPFNNDLPSTAGQLYPAGKVHGLTVYVDPNLKFSDSRIHIGRKGADEEPGVKFLPYIMAESLQTIAEGTFSPKIGMKSRYAIAEAGWHPETQYITMSVTGLGVLTGSYRPSATYGA